MRWLKLLLVVLISFGIYKYRDSLLEATIYATSLRIELLYAAAFVAVGLLASGLRGKYIINRIGGFMSSWDGIKLACVNASSVFSLIRVGVGISLYYLKRKGHLLSHVISYYLGDRFFSTAVFLVLAALLFGNFSWISAAGLLLIAVGALVLVRYTELLPDFWVLKTVKDFSEELKNLVNLKSVLWLTALAAVNFAMESLAFSTLTGANLYVSLAASVIGIGTIIVSPTPGGLGFYEPAVSAYFIAEGLPGNVAIGGVLAFRLFSVWIPALLGLYFLNREL